MKGIASILALQYPGSHKGQGAIVQPLSEIVIGKLRPILLTLLAAAGLLLLIACVNVASLLLVRSESRRREIAVRCALGATRVRIMRQFVTEGMLLAGAACGTGLVVAIAIMLLLTRAVPKSIAEGMPFLSSVGLNADTAMFAAGVMLLAEFLLAFTPTARLSFKEFQGLNDGGRSMTNRVWRRLGSNLVVVELTVTVVLLVGAGLLAKSFYRLLHVDTGFDPSHLATVSLMTSDTVYGKREQRVALFHEIEEKVTALPGVSSAGIASDLPLQCFCDTDWIRIPGRPFSGEHNEVAQREVSQDYFKTLRATLIEGRMFTESDDAEHPRVTIINQALARKYFPGEDPIGKQIGDGGLTPNSMRKVIGLIKDVREGALDEEAWPAEYFSIYNDPDDTFAVVARTGQDEKTMLPDMVKTLQSISPGLGVYGESTIEQELNGTRSALMHRFSTWLVGGFAATALILSVVGLYGVIAYSVSQRTQEIGVRMALGAGRNSVRRLILKEAVGLTLLGLTVGLICSVMAASAMDSLLFSVRAWDVSTLLEVAGILGAFAMLASIIPAQRASSVNPVEALRAE